MKLEIFYDFACPYCYRGLEYLRSQLKERSGYELVWIPCEAHPRPEVHGMHSDLAILGFYYATENGAEPWAFNDAMFKAVFVGKKNIEDITEVAKVLESLGLNAEGFKKAVADGKYSHIPTENNRAAWGENSLHAVPSYKLNGKILGSKDGVVVTEQQLAAFLS